MSCGQLLFCVACHCSPTVSLFVTYGFLVEKARPSLQLRDGGHFFLSLEAQREATEQHSETGRGVLGSRTCTCDSPSSCTRLTQPGCGSQLSEMCGCEASLEKGSPGPRRKGQLTCLSPPSAFPPTRGCRLLPPVPFGPEHHEKQVFRATWEPQGGWPCGVIAAFPARTRAGCNHVF